jgi:hypothetical protein
MATPLNGPLTGEIWHLSIEDLLQPLEEAPRLGGPGPFVINLSASSAPIAQPAKQLAEFAATAQVYQIQRTEDRRPRYRLRLGPFATEDEADALLIKVRDIYPSALTATAESDDLRAIASLQAKAEAMATGRHAQRTAAARPAASVATLRAVPAASAATVSSSAPATAAPRPAPSTPATAARPAPSAPATAAPRPAPSAPATAVPRPAPSAPPAPTTQAAAATPQATPPTTQAAAPMPQATPPTTQAAAPMPQAAAPAPSTQLRAAAPAAPQAQPAVRPHAAAPTPQASARVAPVVAHAAPAPAQAAPAIHAPVRSLAQPLAIPVLADTVSLVRRPPVRATSRRAVAPNAPAPKPVPTITHKVIPTIIHKMVPTITDEVEFAPAPLKTAPEPVALAPVKIAAEPVALAPAQARTAPEVVAPAPVKAAPEAPAAAPVKAVHATPTPALTKTVAASPAPTPVKAMAAAPPIKPAAAAPAQSKPTPQAAPAPIMPVPASPPARRVEALNVPLPNLESTQTLRPLTQLELDDETVSRWFVIQLSLAEEGFDPDSLPNLDIFNEYRLYSVAGIDQGKVMHALRVGFFADEVGAAAVASYLAAFYEKPTIKRISTAERDRFSDQRVEARKDVGATGRHAVIEITNERVVREKRTSATVTPMPARPAPAFQAAGRSGK